MLKFECMMCLLNNESKLMREHTHTCKVYSELDFLICTWCNSYKLVVLFLYNVLVNDAMSQRAVVMEVFESVALIGTSILQVYLLRRLFERKLGTSRV